jgi:phosphoribosylformimino-5-aminoimidazole carboxamide ribotide isomerase
VVDLDGARTGRIRLTLVRAVVAMLAPVGVQVSGGIRSLDDALALLEAGAIRVSVGTAAFASAGAVLEEMTGHLGEALVVSVDVRAGRVAVSGWESQTAISFERAMELCVAAGVRRVACTAVERDGAMVGPDVDLLARACAFGLPVIAAGGVRSSADVEAVAAVGCEAAIVGTALLTGEFQSPS